MQNVVLNGVVAKKPQESFSSPAGFRQVLDPLIERAGIKKKWMIYVAALLSLMEKSDDEIDRRIEEVAAADSMGNFDRLVSRAQERKLSATAVVGIGAAAYVSGQDEPSRRRHQ